MFGQRRQYPTGYLQGGLKKEGEAMKVASISLLNFMRVSWQMIEFF